MSTLGGITVFEFVTTCSTPIGVIGNRSYRHLPWMRLWKMRPVRVFVGTLGERQEFIYRGLVFFETLQKGKLW